MKRKYLLIILSIIVLLVMMSCFCFVKSVEKYTLNTDFKNCAGTWSAGSCANGTRTLTFVKTIDPEGGGAACPVGNDAIKTISCPVNYSGGSWSNWTPPTATGLSTRTFSGATSPLNNGISSPTSDTYLYPVDCQGSWATNNVCNPIDGKLTYTFNQTSGPLNGGKLCPLSPRTAPCNIDCAVSGWNLSNLNTATRTITQSQRNAGAACPTNLSAPRFIESTGIYNFDNVPCINGTQTTLPTITNIGQAGYTDAYLNNLGLNNLNSSNLQNPKTASQWGTRDQSCVCSYGPYGAFAFTGTGTSTYTARRTRSPIVDYKDANGNSICTDIIQQVPVFDENDVTYDSTWSGCPNDIGVETKGWNPTVGRGQIGYDAEYLRTLAGAALAPTTDTTKYKSPKPYNISNFPILTQTCNVNCTGAYGEWTVTNKDTGKQYQFWNVTRPAFGSGTCSIPPPNVRDVLQDCEGTYDSTWSTCNPATGQQRQNFNIQVTPKNGGTQCPLPRYRQCVVPNIYMYQISNSTNYLSFFLQGGVWNSRSISNTTIPSTSDTYFYFVPYSGTTTAYSSTFYIRHISGNNLIAGTGNTVSVSSTPIDNGLFRVINSPDNSNTFTIQNINNNFLNITSSGISSSTTPMIFNLNIVS